MVRVDSTARETDADLNHINSGLPGEIAASAPLAHTVAEAVRISGIGRSKLYELIRSGALDARKLGGRTLIPAEALRVLIADLPRVAARRPSHEHAE